MSDHPMALTDEQKHVFGVLVEEIQESSDGVGLVSAELDGEQVAVITGLERQEDGIQMYPLAVLINDDIFTRLKPPKEEDTDDEG